MKINLTWKQKYETGVDEIDYQHKYFLNLIKRVSEETEQEIKPSFLNRLLMEVAYYGKFHFWSEENIMIKHDYPDLKKHQRLHRELLDELELQISTIEKYHENPIHLIAFLANWFMHHTVEEDCKFAQYLSSEADRESS